MALPYRPLGLVKEILDGLGIEVTYAYEDLVFLQHNPVLLQFGQVGEILFFHVNVETDETEADQLFAAIRSAADGQGITLVRRGRYRLSAGDNATLSLEFVTGSNLS